MSNIDIARAWKDEEYRKSLSEAELAQLPQNPAGEPEEVDEEDLEDVDGGTSLPCVSVASYVSYMICPTRTDGICSYTFSCRSYYAPCGTTASA